MLEGPATVSLLVGEKLDGILRVHEVLRNG
jgi:hypothetical protein